MRLVWNPQAHDGNLIFMNKHKGFGIQIIQFETSRIGLLFKFKNQFDQRQFVEQKPELS
jgi:hypothetical protein